MRAITVFLTTAALYSAYYLTCLLLSPSGNSGVKAVVGLFLVALGLFAVTERKVPAKHVALSAIIAVAAGVLVPLLYLLVIFRTNSSTGSMLGRA